MVQINLKHSMDFLYTNKKHTKKGIMDIFPFIIAPRARKYNKPIKAVKDLHNDRMKLQSLKKDTEKRH